MHVMSKRPAPMRASRQLIVAALLALLMAPPGGATAAPAKDPREKAPPVHSQVQVQVQTASSPRSAAKTPVRPARPEPSWRTGIIDSGQAPFAAVLYRFENQWHEIVDGQHVNVYAGALAQSPEQGVLVLQTSPLGPGARPAVPAVIRAPGASGALRLVSATGAVLHVASASGRRFTFHLPTRELQPG
jgi:hypothetical protein